MRDLLESGLVYIPAWGIGKWICHFDWSDPFLVGWMVAATAVCLRWAIEKRRADA